METFTIKNNINKALYINLIRKICFSYDAEKVHNFFINLGRRMESSYLPKILLRKLFDYQNQILEQNLLGLKFRNPVGLSAGFDKNAEIISIIGAIGFGFSEVGSITAKPCEGNSGKRLLRIPKENSIWVNHGLNNQGTDKIVSEIKGRKFSIPFGVSIAKTNCEETTNTNAGIKDYIYSLKKFSDNNVGDYYTINISCPNAYGGQPFSVPKNYETLLKEINRLTVKKPIFVKLSPDLDKRNIIKIINISENYNIKGFICTNLTKKNIGFISGGLSGKKMLDKSDKLLHYVYKKIRKWKIKPVLIGVGGIFSAEDAYRKIKLGANLVQLITGMIYNGPGIVGEINYGLVKLLKEDGFNNISEAVGSIHTLKIKYKNILFFKN